MPELIFSSDIFKWDGKLLKAPIAALWNSSDLNYLEHPQSFFIRSVDTDKIVRYRFRATTYIAEDNKAFFTYEAEENYPDAILEF